MIGRRDGRERGRWNGLVVFQVHKKGGDFFLSGRAIDRPAVTNRLGRPDYYDHPALNAHYEGLAMYSLQPPDPTTISGDSPRRPYHRHVKEEGQMLKPKRGTGRRCECRGGCGRSHALLDPTGGRCIEGEGCYPVQAASSKATITLRPVNGRLLCTGCRHGTSKQKIGGNGCRTSS